jgi:hypothetical protein
MRDLVADPKLPAAQEDRRPPASQAPDQWLPLYSQVKFSDIEYKDAWKEGLRHDRIMEEVLAMPGIEEKWESEEVERKALGLLQRMQEVAAASELDIKAGRTMSIDELDEEMKRYIAEIYPPRDTAPKKG